MQQATTTPHHDGADREGGPARDVALAVWMADWIDDRYIDPIVGLILPGAGDLLFGAVPVVGDLFDFVFKAHRRNANLLLERHVLGPSPWRDWAAVLGAVLALVVALAVPIGLVALALARFG